jgi:hypothetical protein
MTPQLCPERDITAPEYSGLRRVVGMIARHPDFPGKREAVDECVEDIEERSRQGRLSLDQRAELLDILSARRAPDEPLGSGSGS